MLGEHHRVRALDPGPPTPGREYVCGDATDDPSVRQAAGRVDVVIYAATASHDATDAAVAASLVRRQRHLGVCDPAGRP
jgi:nucleoside-diphosphate-sugar epimerase